MAKRWLHLFAFSMGLLTQPVLSQSVKLANVALGMSETEVKAALSASAPSYFEHDSDAPEMHFLLAEAKAESFAFTFIDGRVAAFSVVHILPPGQQPFLPPGQQPTVSALRNLITKQTWPPAQIKKGDTLWLSDASGAPVSKPSQCDPNSGDPWLPYEPVPAAKSSESPEQPVAGLMKPRLTTYPWNCGVSIHLNEIPADDEDSVVTSVRFQVLDMKAMNAFVKHRKP